MCIMSSAPGRIQRRSFSAICRDWDLGKQHLFKRCLYLFNQVGWFVPTVHLVLPMLILTMTVSCRSPARSNVNQSISLRWYGSACWQRVGFQQLRYHPTHNGQRVGKKDFGKRASTAWMKYGLREQIFTSPEVKLSCAANFSSKVACCNTAEINQECIVPFMVRMIQLHLYIYMHAGTETEWKHQLE